jgi:hypothetical protein
MLTPDMIDRLVSQGEAARELLAHPAWVDVTNDLYDSYLAQMIACPVGDEYRGERDHNHLMLTALRELAAALKHKVRAMEDFYADRNSTEDDDE